MTSAPGRPFRDQHEPRSVVVARPDGKGDRRMEDVPHALHHDRAGFAAHRDQPFAAQQARRRGRGEDASSTPRSAASRAPDRPSMSSQKWRRGGGDPRSPAPPSATCRRRRRAIRPRTKRCRRPRERPPAPPLRVRSCRAGNPAMAPRDCGGAGSACSASIDAGVARVRLRERAACRRARPAPPLPDARRVALRRTSRRRRRRWPQGERSPRGSGCASWPGPGAVGRQDRTVR